ncbi:MAG TPA: DUF4157 domain-containing protein [Acidimicrobiales bacterium]|nr:DUF4157 domain-containing protein [Acidimicrobiales bacterium]
MTRNCELTEAPVHHHRYPGRADSASAPEASPDHQPLPTGMDPEMMQRALVRGSETSRAALADHLQRVTGNRALHRLVEEPNLSHAPTTDLAARIETAAGGGWSIDRKARRKLERGLGAKLDHVRIHDDAEADAMAKAVGAEAFTTGSDIFFRQGAYHPGSREGLRLLAHETTHVLQQAAGRIDGTVMGGSP